MSTTSEVYVDATPTTPLRAITPADLAAHNITTHTRGSASQTPSEGLVSRIGGGSADRTPHTALPQPAPRKRPISANGPAEAPHTALVPLRQPEPATDSDHDELEPVASRAKQLLTAGLPEVFTAPAPSLAERLAYSRNGAWSTSTEGAGRVAHHAYTAAVAIPVTVVAYLAAWAVERPLRLVFIALLLLVGGSALGSLPIVQWLIPNAINVPTWF